MSTANRTYHTQKTYHVVQSAGCADPCGRGLAVAGKSRPSVVQDTSFTFESHNYVRFMPVMGTDQFRGRLHWCPICWTQHWSCFGHADRHWQSHKPVIW